jgi:hypothetical protein
MMFRAALLLLALSTAVEAAAAQSARIANDQATSPVERLHLRGLDTLNGTTRDIDLSVGESVRFGHLEISADTCRVPQADPEGDAYAFLRIRDIREDAPRFSGWMFASSPALSALDHPRYDVWVLSCSSR